MKEKISPCFLKIISVFKRAKRRSVKKKRFKAKWRYFLGLTLFFILAFYFLILKDLPSPNTLARYEIPLATRVYDRNDNLLYEIFAEQKRSLVKLNQIPEHLKQATIAIEDKDFYKHKGVNPIGGILRAMKNIITKKRLEGGSTITQQLIKTALLSPERTIQRKIKEGILATWSELIYSKDQILEMYFNQVPYGGTAWGIQSAAHKYFNKNVEELSLAESALLAGLPAAPTLYSPFGSRPELSIEREHQVLKRMLDDGYITKEQLEQARNEELHFAKPSEAIKAPHFVMYVKDQLVAAYGERMVEQGGLKVTTSLDWSLQEFAQNAVATEIAKLKALRVGNGAAIITRPPTGEILAMVGSADYFSEGYGNVNVTLAQRQPGSSIKPINYAIGIENKIVTPASVFNDVGTCFDVVNQEPYCPKNYDHAFHGPVQLRFALGNSYNIPAVKMLHMNSLRTMVASASAFGLTTITNPDNYGLSLTLGGGEVTMLDMAEAFGVFANAGKRKDVVAILKVEDKNGKTLKEFKDPNFIPKVDESLSYPATILIDGPQVISSETAYLISHILLDNFARTAAFGPSSALVVKGFQAVSVKTGTTNDYKDNWTIGYTPNFLVSVWVGNNDNSPMNPALVSGVTGAAPIWNKIIRSVLANQVDLWPRKPENIVGTSVCSLSGKLSPGEGLCNLRFEYFISGTEPTEVENLKQVVTIDKTTGNFAPSTQTDNVEQQEHQVIKDVVGTYYCVDCPNNQLGATTIKVGLDK